MVLQARLKYFVQLLTGKQKNVSSRNKSTDPLIVNVSSDTFSVANEKQCFLIQTECVDATKVPPDTREQNSKKSSHLAVTWTEAPTSLGSYNSYIGQ